MTVSEESRPPADAFSLPNRSPDPRWTIRRTGHHRRPSGAPPPLPRNIGVSGRVWMFAAAVLLAWMALAGVSPSARRLTERADAFVLRELAGLRTGWLTTMARGIDRVATGWTLFAVAMTLLAVTIATRRWRHLFTYLGSLLAVSVVGLSLIGTIARPRPFDVTIVGRWRGYSLPSATAAIVSITVVGIVYMVVVPGRPRRIAKALGLVAVVSVVTARLYLGVDHPFDVLVGVALGVAVPLVAFRFFTPNDVFPVRYRTGKTAHLDVDGPRGVALRRAVEDQLGVTVLDVKPVSLAASGGSTPLRLRVKGDPDSYLFGKLYAMNHVRADRWYKLGRTILYGRLEDEAPFQSVRRLVEYEDYALRVMRDADIPTAAPLGVVELTPEREYMLVTEFLDGAVELGDADVDDQVIDEGLSLIRLLWDAGLAHRDIKPANLMVKNGHIAVIDVAFAQVRPSPWRQAVDLANMMLVLAVRTDADRVYQRALAFFSPAEIAEAFAAARGIASPSQLRSAMKSDGRDLLAQFRALAPERRPISLQTWGPRRVLLGLSAVAVAVVALVNVFLMFTPVQLPIEAEPSCGTGDLMVLMAQSVPSATALPCVAALPAGWSVGPVDIQRGHSRFSLTSDAAGAPSVDVRFQPPGSCSVDGATEIPSDEVGMRRFERPEQLPLGLRVVRTYLTNGACVTYEFAFDGDAQASDLVALDSAFAFQPRSALVLEVERTYDRVLCGAGAPVCTGGQG